MVKPKHKQNSLPLEYVEDKELTIEKKIEWFAKFWKFIGIEGTPTEQDVLTRKNNELEIMLKKYEEIEKLKEIQRHNKYK